MAKNDDLVFTGTSTKQVTPEKEKVNLRAKDLRELSEKIWKKTVVNFMGIPVKVDDTLKGNSHYIAVSQELYEQIEEEQMKRG